MDLSLIVIILSVALVVFLATSRLLKLPLRKLIFGTVGLIVGLLVSALLNIAISKIPGMVGDYLPLAITALFSFAGIYIFIAQERYVSVFFKRFFEELDVLKKLVQRKEEAKTFGAELIIDTSVIIDGRIEDILKTGFILGKLIITKAVIEELHKISDSKNTLKRSRGRRGLEVLESIQKMKTINTEIIEDDFLEIKEVDEKLIKIAKKRKAHIVTVDYNLNKVAQIQKISVLNINELANALRAVVLPGEALDVRVVQEGKEKEQGVGYLPDGTMIVVEDGNKYIGKTVKTEVTRIFQTAAGRMIFVEPRDEKNN